MERDLIIDSVIRKIRQLPEDRIREVGDFADFLLSKIEDQVLQEGIQKLTSESKAFEYLRDEEDLYTVNDLKEKYK